MGVCWSKITVATTRLRWEAADAQPGLHSLWQHICMPASASVPPASGQWTSERACVELICMLAAASSADFSALTAACAKAASLSWVRLGDDPHSSDALDSTLSQSKLTGTQRQNACPEPEPLAKPVCCPALVRHAQVSCCIIRWSCWADMRGKVWPGHGSSDGCMNAAVLYSPV